MNRIKNYLLFLLLVLSSASCDKVPDNGCLDGMWQLMSIECDGIVDSKKADQVYWSIRKNLVQFNDLSGVNKFAHFSRSGDDMLVYDFCHESGQENETDNDEWIGYEEREQMNHWGVFPEVDANGKLSQQFHFVLLNSSDMILSSGKYRLVFRKF